MPHKWAVGTTFEWEFDFPITTNPAYEAKPAPKRKTRTSANPKAVSSRARKTSKPATVQTAKPKASEKPKRVRLTPDEQRERARARAVENRRKLKELSICKDCRKPAVPGQVRCSSCADKHRKSMETSYIQRERPGQRDELMPHHALQARTRHTEWAFQPSHSTVDAL